MRDYQRGADASSSGDSASDASGRVGASTQVGKEQLDWTAQTVSEVLPLDTVAGAMMTLARAQRLALYGELRRHLPAASWPHATDSKPALGARSIAYLDELVAWAAHASDAELARRCLEARYGLPPLATRDSQRLTQLPEILDLYGRLARLDPDAREALEAATRPVAALATRQSGHPIEEVLHGLELLRRNVGTAIDYTAAGPAGPAAMGMHSLRVNLKLPDAMPMIAKGNGRFFDFLEKVRAYNRAHQPPITIDVVLNPVMKDFGMGFAQLNEMATVGAPGGTEVEPTPVMRFQAKARWMIGRALAAAQGKPSKIAALHHVRATIDRLTERDLATAADVTKYEALVLDATANGQARADDAAEWNDTYADVGARFGADCKQVRAELAPYFDIIKVLELGNEPQAEWVTGTKFPGTATGSQEAVREFEATTAATIAALGAGRSGGPVQLNAPPEWDPATEHHILHEMAQPRSTHDFHAEIVKSPVYAMLTQYVDTWLQHFAHDAAAGSVHVPLALHAYNSPAFDRALIDVLADFARNRSIHLDLYVTEYQVDAGVIAPGKAGYLAAQTRGIVAAGTELELAAAQNHDAVTIRSVLAWSYTKVVKADTVYELDHDTSLDPLLGPRER